MSEEGREREIGGLRQAARRTYQCARDIDAGVAGVGAVEPFGLGEAEEAVGGHIGGQCPLQIFFLRLRLRNYRGSYGYA